MDALVPAPEVRRGRTPPDELDVDVHAAGADVAEQPAEAVAVVEPRVGLELDAGLRSREPLELVPGLACVALPLPELRRVDLHEPHPSAVPQVERIAVADAGDDRSAALGLFALRCATREDRGERDEGNRVTAQG
jgi:hypothetical protein